MKLAFSKTIKIIFDKNSKKGFGVAELTNKLDEEYALVSKHKTGPVATSLTRLTRAGFLIRKKTDNGTYLYFKR